MLSPPAPLPPRRTNQSMDHRQVTAFFRLLLEATGGLRQQEFWRPVTDPLRSFLYVAGGWACLGLAMLGVVLPLLPTTPFVLVASYCFYRGSPRVHAWLHRSQWFGPTLDDWHHYHGIRRGLKHRAILMVGAVVAVSLFYSSLSWWLRYVFLAAVATGLYTIWTVPTLPDDAPRAPRTLAE